jgi:2-isopropylmalate synthase
MSSLSVVERVKEMESRGFTFEAADASFELLLREELDGKPINFFQIDDWVTTVNRNEADEVNSQATVTIKQN